MADDVRIGLYATGGDKAAADVNKVNSAVQNLANSAQKSSGATEQLGGAVADFAKRALPAATAAAVVVDVLGAGLKIAKEWSDAGRDMRPINFSKAADDFKAYDDRVTRFSVSVGANAEQMRAKFERVGAQVGVMPQKLAETAAGLSRMTGTDASDAMKDLATEANDSNRSIEELAELGATLHNQLGVPIGKVGEELRRARGYAEDFGHAGGHVALEDSLQRLSALFAKVQGGAQYAGLALAVLGQGKSKEVAERTVGTIFGAFTSVDPLLATRKFRELTKDPLSSPLVENKETGEYQYSIDALDRFYSYFKGKNYGQALRFFGNNVRATETFLNEWPKLQAAWNNEVLSGNEKADVANAAQSRASLFEAAGLGRKAAPLDELLNSLQSAGGAFSRTAAGRRARTEVEKTNVQLGVGENRQEARDANDAMYEGRRGVQAAIIKAGAESKVLGVARTVGEELQNASQRPQGTILTPIPVKLDEATIQRIAAPKGVSPAAQAVENNRAAAQGAANYR